MAIWAYVGLPRQGKSYNVVSEQIIPALKQGRRVATNIPLVEAELRRRGCTGEIVQLDQNKLASKEASDVEEELAKCTPGAVCVFDEVWRYLPQGLQAKHLPQAWTSLFAEHGHRVDEKGRMMQIVLVTQDLSQIAAFARSLVERTCVVTKLTVVGADNNFRVDVYQGFVTGLKPPISKRLSEEYGKYDKEIFKCYVSRTMAEGQASTVDEKVLSKRGTLWGKPSVKYGLPIAATALVLGGIGAYDFLFGGDTFVGEAKGSSSGARVERSTRAKGVQPIATTRAMAMRLRVAAVLRSENDAYSSVLLDHCDGTPARWVPWMAARCLDTAEGSIMCEWRGARYEFHFATKECRPEDERGSPEIQWFPSDDSGSRESVSVVG